MAKKKKSEKAEGKKKSRENEKEKDKESTSKSENKEKEKKRGGKKEKKRGRKTKQEKREEELKSWKPITVLGRKVKDGEIKDIEEAIENYRILEPQITDTLIKPEEELLKIGQSKGKYGGGKRRVFRQTQKKTAEDNVPTFSCMAVVGDRNGHVGVGMGFAKETFPARDKAIRKAKIEVMKVNRGCGSFDCSCNEPHSIPLKVRGKCGSSVVELMPAPQGTGLVVGDELKKILKLAGIKDVYSKTFGQTRSTINLAKACINALKKTNQIKIRKTSKPGV